ncbi:MAG: UDP-N-acetylmuramoyl-L-alanine--D-glutamate ligase [Patescibacteria group bacterium]|nr:UDP-N-acetylmuramoyl-L-alanine--D-glutamate ligase [Patescibacteria group bacterium]
MNLWRLRNKKVVVFGLGVEGFSTAKFLAENDVEFGIAEKKELSELPSEVREFVKKNKTPFKSGKTHTDKLENVSIIFRNPGIPLWNPKLQEAVKNGAEVSSQTKLFFELCPCPIIGVTGTKGKGTAATLIYEMLKASGRDVYLGGNIGQPPLEFINKLTKDSVVVLELSSFQLEDLTQSPHAAVVLMVTQEHLDSQSPDSPNYHRSLKGYLEAKKNLVRFQNADDLAVINYDFPASRVLSEDTKAKTYFFSTREKIEKGAFIEGEKLILKVNGLGQELCKKTDVFLCGEHNIQNILAASLASLLLGVGKETIINVIKSFKGLEHRLEFVREFKGVKYYNDSFSTTPETAIAAIKSFTEPEILILGGSEKGSDYGDLGRLVAQSLNIKAVILIGVTAPKIKEAIRRGLTSSTTGLKFNLVEGLSSMKEIVEKASSLSKPGDVVVLSPACASFDMFKNYKDRGEQFKDEVNQL